MTTIRDRSFAAFCVGIVSTIACVASAGCGSKDTGGAPGSGAGGTAGSRTTGGAAGVTGGTVGTGGTMGGGGASGAAGATGGTSGASGGKAGVGDGAGGVVSDAGASNGGASACGTPPGTTSFVSDWDADPAKGGWHSIQVVAADRYAKDAANPTWHGFAAAKVTVHPGDDPLNIGTERAEVLGMRTGSTDFNEDANSGTQYFATSYYFPPNWAGTQTHGDSNSWSIIFQLHPPDSGGGALPFVFYAADRGFGNGQQLFLLVNGGDGTGGTQEHFFPDPLVLGQWVDVVFKVVFSPTSSGAVTAWRRNQGQAVFTKSLDLPNSPTISYDKGTTTVGVHYWKQGLYRGPDVAGRTDVLGVGPTARGSTFEAVEKAAFGTCNGPT